MRRKGKTEWNGMQKDKMKWDINLNFFDFIYRRIPHQRRVKKKTKRELVCNSLVLNLVIWMSLLEIILFFISLFIRLFMYVFIYLVRFVYSGKRTGNKRILESTGKEISQVLYLTWNSTKWGTRSKHTQREWYSCISYSTLWMFFTIFNGTVIICRRGEGKGQTIRGSHGF